jgi:non-heme chloroperoxidase
MLEDQMFFLHSVGYRCIAHIIGAHGRSSQPWNGNDMDTITIWRRLSKPLI